MREEAMEEPLRVLEFCSSLLGSKMDVKIFFVGTLIVRARGVTPVYWVRVGRK